MGLFTELDKVLAEARAALAEFDATHDFERGSLAFRVKNAEEGLNKERTRFAQCCWEDECGRAFERSTLREVSLEPDDLKLVEFDDVDLEGRSPQLEKVVPEGWTLGLWTCGCGSDGAFHCPNHPQTDNDRNSCDRCSR